MAKVRTAVVPAAGLGTRLLPVTKALPKELLPIVDRPVIDFVAEEAAAAGVERIVLVTARGKEALVDWFDRAPELDRALRDSGKIATADALAEMSRRVEVVAVRQDEPRGLGHAVLTARPALAGEPFAVMLPDEVWDGSSSPIGQAIRVHDETGEAVVGLFEVEDARVSQFGICEGALDARGRMRVLRTLEKPRPSETLSRHAIAGRYVLPADVLDVLASLGTGALGEIQLTDALSQLASQGRLLGLVLEGSRFDTGDGAGLTLASLHFAMQRPDLADAIREALRTT